MFFRGGLHTNLLLMLIYLYFDRTNVQINVSSVKDSLCAIISARQWAVNGTQTDILPLGSQILQHTPKAYLFNMYAAPSDV